MLLFLGFSVRLIFRVHALILLCTCCVAVIFTTVSLSPVSDQSNKPDWLPQFDGELAFTPTKARDCFRDEAPVPNNFFFIKLSGQIEAIYPVSCAVMQFCHCGKDILKTLLTNKFIFSDTCQTCYRSGGAQM